MPRRLALTLLLLAAAVGAAPAPTQRRALDAAYAGIAKAGERLGARDIARYLLEAAVAGDEPARLTRALETLRTQQELRSADANFGNFRWYRGQPEVKDRNAVQFVCQDLLVLALAHRERLESGQERALRVLLTDAAQGCLSQKVRPDYTNIFLMKACNLVLLGQYLGDASLTEQGRANLREFLTYTRANGITEFNSTTYTGIDMDCAIQLVRLAADPRDQATGRTLLRLLWIEVAANWFAPCQRLGGAHSRDYNYLQGIGATDNQLAANGWIPPLKPDPLGAEADSRRWVAPKAWTESLRDTLPREVLQRWGQGPGMTATHWLTKDYSLGTCGTGKAYDDKVFAAQFPGDRRATMVYFVMESRDDPYGISKEPDSNGHNKTLHLRPSLVTVQNKERALLIAADDTEKPRHLRPVPELKGLWSHLVFPAQAKVCDRDGRELAPGPVDLAEPVFLRQGNVTMGVRFLAARGPGDLTSPAPLRLIRDGDPQQAARFTAEHGVGPHPGKGLFGFVTEVAVTADEAAFRSFAQTWRDNPTLKIQGAEVTAEARGLSATIDVAGNKIKRTGGGATLAPGQPLSVNGRDPWSPLIEEALR